MGDEHNTKGQLIAAMKDHARDGKLPKRVHIPRTFEVDMCLLEREQVGTELAGAILRDGPRKAIQDRGNTLFGLEVVWDATEFKIDAE